MTGRQQHAGFTLIELLVVISIIGLLASIVLAALTTARTKARMARAQMEMKELSTAITYAKGIRGTTLTAITGSTWSAGGCPLNSNLNGIGGACYAQWINDLAAIQAYADAYQGLSKFDRDPWGSPYLLDENEGEGGLCTQDWLMSAGPNTQWESWTGTTGDDLVVNIPNASPACP